MAKEMSRAIGKDKPGSQKHGWPILQDVSNSCNPSFANENRNIRQRRAGPADEHRTCGSREDGSPRTIGPYTDPANGPLGHDGDLGNVLKQPGRGGRIPTHPVPVVCAPLYRGVGARPI